MELDFQQPRAKEIHNKHCSLLKSLSNQKIDYEDPITEDIWFIKKLTSDHPLKEVIRECQNNVRDGFLTPLTDRSSVSLEFTAGMFVDEILENIKIKHLKIIQLDELITNLKDNVNRASSLNFKNYNNNEDDIFEVCVLNQHNDSYQLFLQNENLSDNKWYKIHLNLMEKLNFSLISNNEVLETIQVDMIYQIGNNLQNIQQSEYQQLLTLIFFEESYEPLKFELKISMRLTLSQIMKKKIIASLNQEIQEINSKVEELIDSINRMLEPFSNEGLYYIRQQGIVDRFTKCKSRNQCCQIF